MTEFIESPRFPNVISKGARGGPRYRVDKTAVRSGAVYRNLVWDWARHEYDAACGVRIASALEVLLYFFHVVGGPSIGFRFKDWLDYKSCIRSATPTALDCSIGTGDGSDATWQLYKTYVQGAYSRQRQIRKPVSGTVLVAVAGTLKTETTQYTVDYTTGIITFTAGNIPTVGQAITAGFEFDVPVYFAEDIHQYTWNDYVSGAAQVPLIEDKYSD